MLLEVQSAELKSGMVKGITAQRIRQASTRTLTCLILVGVVTYALFSLIAVNALIASFAYLLIILIVAASWGFLESIITSITAMLCLNFFFFPPILTITIADPQNWVALFGFMATAITASQLSTRAHKRTLEAQAHQAEVEQLYALSRSLMMLSELQDVGVQIAHLVKNHFGFRVVAFCDSLDGRIAYAGSPAGQPEMIVLQEIAAPENRPFFSRKKSDDGDECVMAAVTLGGRLLGSLGAVGAPISEPAWQAVANLAGITVERLRSQAVANRIEATRQGELLRSLLLDALAHDFETPLTSIKGAVTTVRSSYPHEPDEDDLLAVVEEETDKLSGMIDEATDLARIESGHFQIRRRRVAPPDVIHTCVEQMASLLDGRDTEINLLAEVPDMNADPELAGLALRQLISNAVKYSPPGSKIEISGRHSEDMVVISVRDEGPGVSPNETDAIFGRYYRGSRAQGSIPGTGMGLSIARDIIAAHGGRIWVKNRADKGAEFAFTLPIASEERG